MFLQFGHYLIYYERNYLMIDINSLQINKQQMKYLTIWVSIKSSKLCPDSLKT